MSQYKVTYFDLGGRAEPIRIAMHAAGLKFEDERWSFPEFGANRESKRFHAVPSVEIDGKTITQSNAISRYFGKMSGLYPEDAMQALYCDEVLGALEDMTHYVVQTFGLEGDALKQAREKLLEGRLTTFMKGLDELLTRGGGYYFAGGSLSIADIRMMGQVQNLRAGHLEHIPKNFVDTVAPGLVSHAQNMAKEPKIMAYYASLKSA